MAPIVKEQAEEDENIPKLLCQIDNHLGEHQSYYLLSHKLYVLKTIYYFSMCELCEVVKFRTVSGFWRR